MAELLAQRKTSSKTANKRRSRSSNSHGRLIRKAAEETHMGEVVRSSGGCIYSVHYVFSMV